MYRRAHLFAGLWVYAGIFDGDSEVVYLRPAMCMCLILDTCDFSVPCECLLAGTRVILAVLP